MRRFGSVKRMPPLNDEELVRRAPVAILCSVLSSLGLPIPTAPADMRRVIQRSTAAQNRLRSMMLPPSQSPRNDVAPDCDSRGQTTDDLSDRVDQRIAEWPSDRR
jgi:hypothetical protein